MSRTLTMRWLAVAAALMVGACSDAGSAAQTVRSERQFSVASDAAPQHPKLLRPQL